jgi:hypothetical protein
MANERDPAQYAADIDAARQRLLAFAQGCGDADWDACVLGGDPRPVGVVVDHVADSYEYLAGWIGEVAAGQSVAVNPEVIDELNAQHAVTAARVSQAAAAEHLRASGDALIELVRGLAPADLDAGDGRVRRFVEVSIRHADDHRSQLRDALAAAS